MSLTKDELNRYWESAEILHKGLDAAEYKNIVLGLVFLKYVSDAFADRRTELEARFGDPKDDSYKADGKRRLAALEERDYYTSVNVFWVPENARWEVIQSQTRQPTIAQIIDSALLAIERENPKLESIVQRKYAEAKLKPEDLGDVVDLIGSINFGKGRRQAADVLGQVYEYFLGKFASAEGKLGGQFYTTPSIVKTLVSILQPLSGRVYDPCCGSGGMFVQSERFVESHGGRLGDISIYGQESNPTTRRLAAMNLAIRGIDFDLGKTHGDTFTEDQHQDKRFDFIMMNPPFQRSSSYPRTDLADDVRFKKYGLPREAPAHYAWMSHALHHLSPNGKAGVVMARGSLTSMQGGDDVIRKAFLDDDVVECIIDLPPQLFFNTPIPSCIWFFNKNKGRSKNNRENQVLFIDARKMGYAISRKQIEFSDEEIERLAGVYTQWTRGDYEDIEGLCKSATRQEILEMNDNLSPGRYIGTETIDVEEVEDFDTRIGVLLASISENIAEGRQLDEDLQEKLRLLGYEL
jgi:type I restriction enzyme M protein